MTLPQVVLIFVLLPAILLILFMPGLRRRAPTAPASGNRDDDRYWTFEVLYINPDDPGVFVPKRYVPGRTINIGHPLGRLLTLGILLLVVLLAILTSTGGLPVFGCHPSGCNL